MRFVSRAALAAVVALLCAPAFAACPSGEDSAGFRAWANEQAKKGNPVSVQPIPTTFVEPFIDSLIGALGAPPFDVKSTVAIELVAAVGSPFIVVRFIDAGTCTLGTATLPAGTVAKLMPATFGI